MTHKELHEYVLGFEHAWLDYPFGDKVAVYKIGEEGSKETKMFALIDENSAPLRLSLKCDPFLSETLREKYETVVPGYHLNKKHWNTIICTGQLDDEEMKDLIRLSYNLVSK